MSRPIELHRHHSPEKLKSLAHNLYREKKYAEALEAFSAAIQAGKDDDLTLYDNRAATYEKLDNLHAALSDGNRMLRIGRTEIRGYLRTGKILQKMDKNETALKIYERGLKLVPSTSEHYRLLRNLHNNLSRTLCPPEAIDFLTILPIEVIEMIINYLPFHQLCRCLRVSKHWNKFLTSYPLFWRDMDFSSSKSRPVSMKAVFQYMGWARGSLTRAVIRGLNLQGSNVLREITVKCKALRALEVHSGGALRQSLLDATSRATNLRTLVLSSSVVVEDAIVRRALESLPALRVARFDSVQLTATRLPAGWIEDYPTRLEQFSILCHNKSRVPARMPHLELDQLCPPSTYLQSLRVVYDNHDGEAWPIKFDNLAESRPCLEALCLQSVIPLCCDCNEANASHTKRPLTLPTTLKKLNLVKTAAFSTSMFTPGSRVDASICLPSLVDLCVKDEPEGILPFIRLMALLGCSPSSLCPRLERLDIAFPGLPPSGLIDFLGMDNLWSLQYLTVRDSDLLDDSVADIIASKFPPSQQGENHAANICAVAYWRNLRHLALPSTKITGVSIKKLVQGLPHLERLDVRYCANIGGDAIEWARGQGVKVSHHLLPD